jgi:hypothetical protein
MIPSPTYKFPVSIECAVCMEVIRVPKTLHCGHTFCGVCVDLLTKDHTAVHCATCRHVTPVPQGGLPKNVLLEVLIEERETATAKRLFYEITTAAEVATRHYNTTLPCADCHDMHDTMRLLACTTCCTDFTMVTPLCLPCLIVKHQVGVLLSNRCNMGFRIMNGCRWPKRINNVNKNGSR